MQKVGSVTHQYLLVCERSLLAPLIDQMCRTTMTSAFCASVRRHRHTADHDANGDPAVRRARRQSERKPELPLERLVRRQERHLPARCARTQHLSELRPEVAHPATLTDAHGQHLYGKEEKATGDVGGCGAGDRTSWVG